MNNECYLIKDSWINAFIRSYDSQRSTPKYKTKYTKRNINTTFSLPPKGPEFLNDITSVIDCIKNRINFILVNKELMEFVFKNNKNELRNYKCISYYTGNKKIIIEFKTNNENNALLLFDPLKINKKNAYLIEKTNNERNNIILYENILNKFSPYLINIGKYKDKIKTFDYYINNKEKSITFEDENNQRRQYCRYSTTKIDESIPNNNIRGSSYPKKNINFLREYYNNNINNNNINNNKENNNNFIEIKEKIDDYKEINYRVYKNKNKNKKSRGGNKFLENNLNKKDIGINKLNKDKLDIYNKETDNRQKEGEILVEDDYDI